MDLKSVAQQLAQAGVRFRVVSVDKPDAKPDPEDKPETDDKSKPEAPAKPKSKKVGVETYEVRMRRYPDDAEVPALHLDVMFKGTWEAVEAWAKKRGLKWRDDSDLVLGGYYRDSKRNTYEIS